MRAGPLLPRGPADLRREQLLEPPASLPQPGRHDHPLFAPVQPHEDPVLVLGIRPEQCRVPLAALRLGAPVKGAHVGAPAREQREAELGAGGGMADQRLPAQLAGDQHQGPVEQRVVAACDHHAVGEQAAVGRLQHPLVHEVAREQPLAGQARGGNASLVDQGVDLLLVDLQVAGDLAHVHVAGRLGLRRRRVWSRVPCGVDLGHVGSSRRQQCKIRSAARVFALPGRLRQNVGPAGPEEGSRS